MISSKEKFRDYTTLSKREQRGLLVTVSLMALIIFLPDIYINSFLYQRDLDYSIEERLKIIAFSEMHYDHDAVKTEITLFPFDPNTVDKAQMKELGFQDFLSDRIIKYRNAGGKFHQVQDLLKMYGIKEAFYLKLKPYINITLIKPKQIIEKTKIDPIVENKLTLNINVCDSADLIRLKGIGPVYASRIIRYRKALGGYTTVRQLKEIYGLTDSTYQKIEPNIYISQLDSINKIHINNVSSDQLRRHPYFRNYNLSASITNFRKQHGDYSSLDDLKLNVLVTDSTLEKISPYITFD